MANYIIAQILGILGLIVVIISFQLNTKRSLLICQCISSFLFAIQYILLNAITGFCINMTCLVRNLIFIKYGERKIPIAWIILTITVMTILSVSTYDGIISILPTISGIIYSIGIWQSNLKVTRICDIIACLNAIIYNISYLAIAGVISSILEMSSSSIALYRFNIKKDIKINKNVKNNIKLKKNSKKMEKLTNIN